MVVRGIVTLQLGAIQILQHAFVKGVDVSFQLNHALRENAKDCRDVHPKYGKDEVRLDASVIWVRNTLS